MPVHISPQSQSLSNAKAVKALQSTVSPHQLALVIWKMSSGIDWIRRASGQSIVNALDWPFNASSLVVRDEAPIRGAVSIPGTKCSLRRRFLQTPRYQPFVFF